MSETKKIKVTASPDSPSSDSNGEEKADAIKVVHSANAWEKADLGDDERKTKFLRLMGAGKKAHHGRFVIGEHNPEHPRSRDETEQLQNQLEDQYTHSMQHRLAGGRHGHIGLGYHDADLDAKPPEEGCDHPQNQDEGECEERQGGEQQAESEETGEEEDSAGDDKERAEATTRRKKRESKGRHCEDHPCPVEKKMKFMKSSS